jgi:tetratricopeptide (TPR) repeat protein
MHLLASLATLFTLSLVTLSVSAQINQAFSGPITVHTISNIVRGTILRSDGRPASDVHVELDQDGTAIPVSSTYTEQDGAFELYNIPGGSYELVAESKDARVDQHVQLQSGESEVQLRLPRNTASIQEAAPTVSVVQMMVPESAQKLLRKALAAFEHGNYDKSKSLLDSALQIDPQYAEALTLRGSIEMSQGDLSGAQQDLERAVQVDPNYSGAYVELGAIYNHQGRFDDATGVSERGLTISPRSWQGYFEMAKAAIGKGMYEKGLQLAARAQRLSGNSFAAVHLIKAYALLPMRFYKDAKYELQAFLSREPNSSNARQAQMLLAEIDSMPSSTVEAHQGRP